MISDATSGLPADMELPKLNLNSSKDGARRGTTEGAPVLSASASVYSLQTESLHLKYTSRDGDVLEISSERTEETYSAAGVRNDAGPRKPSGAAGVEVGSVADENAAAAEAAKDGDSADARLLKLERLREWATEVEGELRKQQQKILEEFLKKTGKFMDGGEGRFFVLYAPTPEEIEGAEKSGDAGVPEYWNAENTSDRIVHFATQMAEIAGGDPEFAETIIQAVTDGFDQANAITGALPGEAGKLNEKTRELTFSKLSKWLEERKVMLEEHKVKSYNQGNQSGAISTAEVSHGTENHEQ